MNAKVGELKVNDLISVIVKEVNLKIKYGPCMITMITKQGYIHATDVRGNEMILDPHKFKMTKLPE